MMRCFGFNRIFFSCKLIFIGLFSTGDVLAGAFFPENPAPSLSAGDNHTCTVTNEMLKCWGDNTFGQISRARDILNPSQVVAGSDRTCVASDDNFQCFGFGKIEVPLTLNHLNGWSLGNKHTCAIADSIVNCWYGEYAFNLTPGIIANAQQLSAGENHTCVLADNQVRCWKIWKYVNYNTREIAPEPMETPEDLLNPTHLTSGRNHTCVVSEGKVRCWGQNFYGQLEVPSNLSFPKELAAGGDHTCVLTGDGVRCWGRNDYGQLDSPPDLENPSGLTVGGYHTCVLVDGGARCWGRNDRGQLSVPTINTYPVADLRRGIGTIIDHAYQEKRFFLEAINSLVKTSETPDELAFTFFTLQTFFGSMETEWARFSLHPDLQKMVNHYRELIGRSSLIEFHRSSGNLRLAFRIINEALSAPRSMLTIESQREVEQIFLPELAERFVKPEILPEDGAAIAALFREHDFVLREMNATSRLKPFAQMIEELNHWLSGS